jgi:hypothetical protein
LASFHHCEPDKKEPEDNDSNNWWEAKIGSGRGLVGEHGGVNNDERQDEECARVEVLEGLKSCSDDRTWSFRVGLCLSDQFILRIVTWVVGDVSMFISYRKDLAGLVLNLVCRCIISTFVGKWVGIGVGGVNDCTTVFGVR